MSKRVIVVAIVAAFCLGIGVGALSLVGLTAGVASAQEPQQPRRGLIPTTKIIVVDEKAHKLGLSSVEREVSDLDGMRVVAATDKYVIISNRWPGN